MLELTRVYRTRKMYLKLIFLLGFAWSVSSKPVDSCLFTESEHWLITLDRLHQSLTNVDQSNCDSLQCSFPFQSFLQPTQLEESSTNCYQTGETHQDILNSFQCIRGKPISEMGCIMRHTLRVIKRMVNQCS
ncbi:uncharacterized protein LOC117106554 isoform X2 [Anneissia japonica]|uniref:uncharacterized protein LOC117106554 isoform X2 n=1 Tax=Anneissia japonica TaxID=1529436 RepID=UPI001425B880|nr:uncharacterized protein LOC117106554 isoform X2 [Anneissia japonica]